MALTRINFDVAGDTQYSRAFEAMSNEARDLSEPLSRVGRSLIQTVTRQFDTQGAYGLGHRWKPLSPDYQAWKEAHYPDTAHLILVRTRDMRAAAQDPSSLSVTPRRLTYEIDDPKAIYHQEGKGNLPQRKIVAIPLQVRRSWDRTFAEWVNELRRGPLWRGAGL